MIRFTCGRLSPICSNSVQGGRSIGLLYATVDGEAQLLIDLPKGAVTSGETFLRAKFPDVQIERTTAGVIVPERVAWNRTLRLNPDIQPLRFRQEFQDQIQRDFVDPASTLLQAVQDISQESQRPAVRSMVRIQVAPVTTLQKWLARRVQQRLSHKFWHTHTILKDVYADWAMRTWFQRLLVWPVSLLIGRGKALDDNAAKKLDSQLCNASIELISWSSPNDAPLARKQLSVMASAFAEFTEPGRCRFVASRMRKGIRRKPPTSLLSDADLAQLWHIPTDTVHTPTLARPTFRQLPPPVNLLKPHEAGGAAKLGEVAFAKDNRMCFLAPDDRLHSLIIGKSGTGKSTLMNNLIAHDAFSGAGVGVVDPHSDLVEDILRSLPKSRTNEIVLLDVADRQRPVTFNPLACSDPHQRPLIASSLLSALKKVFGFDETNAPRLINTLRYTLLALLEQEGSTLLHVRRVLIDKKYRRQVAGNLADEEVRSFWQDEVASWTDRYEKETMPAILNKLGQFTANPITRAMSV